MSSRAGPLLLAGLCCLRPGGAVNQPPAPADQVLIVTSSGIAPYEEVLEGIRKAGGRPPYVLDLRQSNAASMLSEAPRFKNIRVVVAIGAEAVEALSAERGSAPVIAAAVTPHLLPKDAARRPASMVQVQVPLGTLLESIKTVFPEKHRLAFIRSPNLPEPAAAMLKAAESAGFSAKIIECAGPTQLLRALQSLQDQADLVLCFPDAALYNSATIKPLILASLRYHLPLVGFSESFVRAGAVMGVYPDFHEIGSQSAELIQKILNGQAVSRSEAPRKFRIAVNQNITRLLGLAYAQPRGGSEDFLVIR